MSKLLFQYKLYPGSEQIRFMIEYFAFYDKPFKMVIFKGEWSVNNSMEYSKNEEAV